MGIEALASIGKAVSVAPAAGRSVGVSMGKISGFPAPKMEGFSIKSISNPFLTEVKSSFVGNKRFLNLRNRFEEAVVRKAQTPSVIARNIVTKQSSLEIATLQVYPESSRKARNDVWKLSDVRVPEPLIVWPVEPTAVWVPQQFRKPEIKVQPMPFPAPKAESKPQVIIQTWLQLEPQPAIKPQTESAVMFAQPKPLEQKNEEKKMQVQLQPRDKQDEEEEVEDEEETRKRFLRDDETLKIRLENLIAIISNVSEDDDFTGEMLKRLMPQENTRLRSEVLKKYTHTATYETIVDGSYEEMLETFGLLGKFRSKQEAYDKARRVIEDKKPVRWGKDGTPVSRKDVDRVFKKHLVKPNFMEEVEKRNNKKAFQQAA